MAQQKQLWIVHFDSEAVVDFERVKGRANRKAVMNVVRKLRELGPGLPSPHAKSLQGETDLFELRPRQGACEVRLIYARFGWGFLVLAVAAKKPNFGQTVLAARTRLNQHLRLI